MKLEELNRTLRGVDPAAVLVARPVLERVVQNVTGLTWVLFRVPHAQCLLVDRGTLFRNVDQEELYLPPDHLLPESVLLLERPSNEVLAAPREEVLGRYWRLLFHATAHRELERQLTGLTPAGLRERIERLGPAAFEEARNVLIQDGQLQADADDREAYVEFVASFLELLFFAPNLIPVCFPSLPPVAAVQATLLYDLQRACLEHEQKIYTLDVIEWVVSGGKRPIKRELPSQKFVRVPNQLRSAARRLAAARLSDADRQALAGLLRDALNRAEDRLRGEFRPLLAGSLLDAGLRPASLPEQAALEKTVEEL